MDQVNQELILWLLSGFGAVISVLLGWIGVMQRETKAVITQKITQKNDEQDKRLDKHDEKFDKVHQEIKGLAISIAASVKRRK